MSSALARRKARSSPLQMPSVAGRLGVDSGCHRLLETPLVINGAAGTSDWAYVSIDATQTTWAARVGGVLLTKQAGTPVISTTTPYLGSLDGLITGDGTAYYTPPDATALDITTEDVWFETVVVHASVDSGRLTGKVNAAGLAGWQVIRLTTEALRFLGYGNGVQIVSPTMTAGAISYVSFHINRDEASTSGARGYTNGSAGTGFDYSANAASWTTTQVARVLSNPNYGTPWTGGILWLRLSLRAGWFAAGAAGAAEALVVHQTRFALLTASRPAFSVVPSTYPSAAGSTSPVYQQRRLGDGTDQLFYMGAGSPTFDRVVDAAGRAVVAHLVEIGATSMAARTRTIDSWTVIGACVLTANDAAGPDGKVLACKAAGLGDNGVDMLYYITTGFTTTDPWRPSVWCKRVSTTGTLRIVNGQSGPVYGDMTVDLSVLPDRWVRLHPGSPYVTVVVPFVVNGTSAGMGICASVGKPLTVHLDFSQHQYPALDYVSSEIITTTAAVTRAASLCQYSLANCFPRAEGTLLFALLARSFTPTRNRVAFSLSDGTTTNELQVYTDTSGRVNASSRKAGGTSGDCQIAGSIMDNYIRRGMLSWRQGQLDLWTRSAAGVWTRSQDLTVDAIAGATLTTLSVGSDGAAANQIGPGAWPLAGWQVIDHFVEDPSAARSGLDMLWESM